MSVVVTCLARLQRLGRADLIPHAWLLPEGKPPQWCCDCVNENGDQGYHEHATKCLDCGATEISRIQSLVEVTRFAEREWFESVMAKAEIRLKVSREIIGERKEN